jgi:hypothetical protein
LAFCWAVLGAPAGKRLAPMMAELVPRLRRFGELIVSDEVAAALVPMSAATMDRRLAADRAKMALRGRSHTKPGSLLKSQIPIRTWAQWDDAVPGFVEIDLVGHEGGNAVGDHCYTLTVTDIATGWTENRSVKNKARRWVIAALEEARYAATSGTRNGTTPSHHRRNERVVHRQALSPDSPRNLPNSGAPERSNAL